eukprot:9979593-Karenia_brevis.AAC.1
MASACTPWIYDIKVSMMNNIEIRQKVPLPSAFKEFSLKDELARAAARETEHRCTPCKYLG